ncbi:hypothetical protein NQ176_g1248 [Zarea fungicola]|uniref:Uncharacterized protein n=1 Tax=Zarea fungicola TaxID=93591 RepID=A0ACC1NW40_9HYPO|nr:hypothetical protein NQ176_g1248 [Lecanicillium fungicola]
MTEIPYSNILSSKPFRFFVGPHRNEFTLHSTLVASQSRALDAIVNSTMKEAADGATNWEHVDEQTFIRFGQYVYTGNYEGEPPSKPELDLNEGDTDEKNGEPADDDFWAIPSKKSKKKKIAFGDEPVQQFATKREQARHSFEIQRSYDYGDSGACFDVKNTDCRVEYKNVFLSHARLHMLADYYGIEQLAQLTLHKLHRALCSFQLHEERVCDVVDLLRFCFEEEEPVQLRELVVMYTVCQFEKLWKNADFKQLLMERVGLSVAVLGSMLARLD